MLPEAKCGRGAQNPRDRKSKLSYNMSSFFRARGKPARRRTNGESAQRYLEAEEAGQKADAADYSQYVSRIVSMQRMIDEPANFLVPSFFETTDSMSTLWASLEKMEMEMVLKVITGEQDISAFDSFVESWTSAGGDKITQEVNDAIAK